MSANNYPCPNGCPRDAGEYCQRHTCQSCSEILRQDEGLQLCNKCVVTSVELPTQDPQIYTDFGL